MATQAELKQQQTLAQNYLESRRDTFTTDRQLLINQRLGRGQTDYLQVHAVYSDQDGQIKFDDLTWALARVIGYRLRDVAGGFAIALNGGGYSKPLELAISLARYYGLNDYHFQIETLTTK